MIAAGAGTPLFASTSPRSVPGPASLHTWNEGNKVRVAHRRGEPEGGEVRSGDTIDAGVARSAKPEAIAAEHRTPLETKKTERRGVVHQRYTPRPARRAAEPGRSPAPSPLRPPVVPRRRNPVHLLYADRGSDFQSFLSEANRA